MNDSDPAKRSQEAEDDFQIPVNRETIEEPLFQTQIDVESDPSADDILAEEVEIDVSDSQPVENTPAPEEAEKTAPEVEAASEPAAVQSAPDMAAMEALTATVNALSDQLESIGKALDRRISEAAVRNELFDKLYADMEKYRNDIYAKLLKPFVLEAISILEDYRRVVGRIDTLTPEQLAKYLRNIPDDIVSLLENNGVDIVTEKDDAFNRRTQQIVKTVPTNDPALDGKVAARIKPGYEWNGTLLRQEKVEVYKLNPTAK